MYPQMTGNSSKDRPGDSVTPLSISVVSFFSSYGSGTGNASIPVEAWDCHGLTEHGSVLSGLPGCGPRRERAACQPRATPILPPGWAWHPEVTKMKKGSPV